MKIYRSLDEMGSKECAVLTIGSFDGVHKGHQQLISQTVLRSRVLGCQSGVLTFDPLPKQVLGKSRPMHYLTTLDEKIELIGQIGPDSLLVLPFNKQVAEQPPEVFMEKLNSQLEIKELWMGERFTLGKDRVGNPKRLAEIGETLGFKVHVCHSVKVDGHTVSSTAIRQLVLSGNVEQAERMLGHYHAIAGNIVAGDGRGRTLGFPTANLLADPLRAIPANGVYAVLAQIVGGSTRRAWPAVMNIGHRPSFGGRDLSLEVHLLDFEGDIYGRELRIMFVQRLRPETKFTSTKALQRQISEDILVARSVLAEARPPAKLGPIETRELDNCDCIKE